MTMRDQSILLDKGFRIFRRDLTRLKITEASKAGGWKLYSNHSSFCYRLYLSWRIN